MKLPMKLLRTAGLCLMAMLAMSMVAAGTASAAPHWLHCETEKSTGPAPTKFSESQCESYLSTGTWAWQEVTGTEAVVSHGSLQLTDTDTALGAVSVSCSGENIGSVGPKQFDRITEIKNVVCSNEEHCSGEIKAKAVNLPWQTELVEEEGKIRDKITNSGTEASKWPGWEVSCGGLADKCTTNSGSTAIANQTTVKGGKTELLVLATFAEPLSHKAICTQSLAANKETGEVQGTIATLQANGQALRVS